MLPLSLKNGLFPIYRNSGPARPTVTVELRRGGQPVDIARLVG